MAAATFVVAGLIGAAGAGDLSSTLETLSGVEDVSVDLAAHTVTVQYDPAFVSVGRLRRCVVGSGYPVEREG